MTAESSRKPSTEPERTPVENARLLLPQLSVGQRAVVGALIAECERIHVVAKDLASGALADSARAAAQVFAANDRSESEQAGYGRGSRETFDALCETLEQACNGGPVDATRGRFDALVAKLAAARIVDPWDVPEPCDVCDGDTVTRRAVCVGCDNNHELASLRAQLAEVTRERDAFKQQAINYCGQLLRDCDSDELDRCDRCGERVPCEWADHDCPGYDPLDAELDRIVAARAKPEPVASVEPWTRLGWEWRAWGEWRDRLVTPSGYEAAEVNIHGDWWIQQGNTRGGTNLESPGCIKASGKSGAKSAAWNALCDRGWHGLTAADRTDAKPAASDDDPHGLGAGWRRRTGGSWEQAWEHETGAMIGHLKGDQYWHYFYPRQPRSTGDRTDNGAADTAREAAALALGKPTVAREIDWDLIGDALIIDGSDDGDRFARNPYKALRVTVLTMLRALVNELRRTGAIAGKDGGK